MTDILIGALIGAIGLSSIVTHHYMNKAEYYQYMYTDAADIIHEQSIRIDGLQTRELLTAGDCQLGIPK